VARGRRERGYGSLSRTIKDVLHRFSGELLESWKRCMPRIPTIQCRAPLHCHPQPNCRLLCHSPCVFDLFPPGVHDTKKSQSSA
jgi:hypothetical protein